LLAIAALTVGFGSTNQSYEIVVFLALVFIAVITIGVRDSSLINTPYILII